MPPITFDITVSHISTSDDDFTVGPPVEVAGGFTTGAAVNGTTTISFGTDADGWVEPDETYTVRFTNVVFTNGDVTPVASDTGAGTITNDDEYEITVDRTPLTNPFREGHVFTRFFRGQYRSANLYHRTWRASVSFGYSQLAH